MNLINRLWDDLLTANSERDEAQRELFYADEAQRELFYALDDLEDLRCDRDDARAEAVLLRADLLSAKERLAEARGIAAELARFVLAIFDWAENRAEDDAVITRAYEAIRPGVRKFLEEE